MAESAQSNPDPAGKIGIGSNAAIRILLQHLYTLSNQVEYPLKIQKNTPQIL
jgi:hypothetical protein